MYELISNVSYKVYFSFKDFINRLTNDERGLSGVVVAILLILVAVLAVVMIWGFLSGWLKTVWDNITGQAANIN